MSRKLKTSDNTSESTPPVLSELEAEMAAIDAALLEYRMSCSYEQLVAAAQESLDQKHTRINEVIASAFFSSETEIGYIDKNGNHKPIKVKRFKGTRVRKRYFRRRLLIFQAKMAEPPKAAGFLMEILLSPKEADAAIGDLDENFEDIRGRYGLFCAHVWYWCQTIRSLWPLITDACRRLMIAGGIEKAWTWLSHVKW